MGTVSADGKSIVSNPDVGIPKFCCGASRAQRDSGGNNPGRQIISNISRLSLPIPPLRLQDRLEKKRVTS